MIMKIGQEVMWKGKYKITYAGPWISEHLFCLPVDEGRMTWDSAMQNSFFHEKTLIRLPSRAELDTLHKNKKEIGGFQEGYYWSRDEESVDNAFALHTNPCRFGPDHESSGSKERTLLVRYVLMLPQWQFEALHDKR